MLAPNHKETPDKIHSLTLRSTPLYTQNKSNIEAKNKVIVLIILAK